MPKEDPAVTIFTAEQTEKMMVVYERELEELEKIIGSLDQFPMSFFHYHLGVCFGILETMGVQGQKGSLGKWVYAIKSGGGSVPKL